MVRFTMMLTLFCMISSLFLLVPVQAGDTNHPDFEDSEGDADKEEHDIISGWMGEEKNDTINVVLQLISLPAFTPPADVPNLPTTEYRFYFSMTQGILRSNYVAVARVPVRGPFGVTLSFQVCSHVYNGTEPGELTGCKSTSGRYASSAGQINFTIDKSDIGGPKESDVADDMWGQVFYYEKGSGLNFTAPEEMDRAPDEGFGDGIYVFRGTSANIFKVFLFADHTVDNATAVKPAEYDISIQNNGTSKITVDLHNSTGSAWGVQLTPAMVTIEPLQNKSALLKVWPKDLRAVANGDAFSCEVWGSYKTDDNQTKDSENKLTFVTTAVLPPPEKEKKDQWAAIFGAIKKNLNLIVGLIVFFVVLGLVVKVARGGMLKRKAKKMEEAYIKEEGKDGGAKATGVPPPGTSRPIVDKDRTSPKR